MQNRLIALLGLLLISSPLLSRAAEPYVPAELDPWVQWVNEAHPQRNCPTDAQSGDVTRCVWISRVGLSVGERLSFVMNVRTYAEVNVPLPGNAALRPTGVTSNGDAIAVTGQEHPLVHLGAGTHTLTGEIRWAHRPASVPLPAQFGLISLTVDGESVPQPLVRDGGVVLARNVAAETTQTADTQTVDVYRLVLDNEPLAMLTVVNVDVAGRPRLITLGRALLDGFELMDFEADLPARITPSGDVELQAVAGEHEIQFRARATGVLTSIGMEQRGDIWPAQEIWGFIPDRNLRLVEAGGAPGMDLSQVDWPVFDGEFDATEAQGFLVSKDQPLALNELQRGNPNPPPDAIGVNRDIWVNFAGDGFIVKDLLTAEIRQSKRLTASYPLGRIELDGEAELVNTVDGGEPGIELQQGSYTIESVSAVPRDSEQLANGWRVDAQSLRGTLHLPPGWRLLWAGGVDSAPESWLEGWSLWNVFVLVFAVVLAFRFLKPAFAILSLIGLLLLLPGESGIAVCWLLAIGAVSVLKRFDDGKLVRIGRTVTWVWLVITSLITLDLAINSAQQAVYPQLEPKDWVAFDAQLADADYRNDVAMAAPAEADMARSPAIEEVIVTAAKSARQVYNNRYREGVQVQTGPGLPQWTWNVQSLVWNGPVAATQTLDLTLAPPALVRVGHVATAVISVLLMALLFLALLGRDTVQARLPKLVSGLLPLLVVTVLVMPEAARADSTPSESILKVLEERLLTKPDCFPGCASVESLEIDLSADRATLDLRIHAGALVSVPLISGSTWMPSSVSVDGEAAVLTRQGDVLEIALREGVHRVQLTGAVAHLERFEIGLPTQPAVIETDIDDMWLVSGVIEGRAVGGSLGFERQKRQETREDAPALQQDAAAPFVEVGRHIRFDLDWQVSTQVTRLAPAVGGFTVKVALLPGESILGGGYQADGGFVEVVFGPTDTYRQWSGVLKRESPLTLQAAEAKDQVQRWFIESTNLWHVGHDGLTPVLDEDMNGVSFRPRTGEELVLTATPTEPLPGTTSTVESIRHHITPGDRLATHQLDLTLRASQGGNYLLSLPDGTNSVTSVTIDGDEAPIPLKDNQLALPVLPGSTSYVIGWTSEETIGVRYTATPPTFAGVTSNITSEVQFPENRWVLFLGGPTMGPAMLFWGVMIVVLILAAGIARIPGIALTRTDALLLAAGLALCNLEATLLVAVWLLLLAVRPRWLESITSAASKNLVQILTGFVTVITVLVLIASVPDALLSSPDMQIEGNDSGSHFYRWFTDQAGELPPEPWVISLPMWVYRAAMLGWSLWLAFALIRWVRAAWEGFKTPEAWYERQRPIDLTPPSSGQSSEGAHQE
jgi:hypothetical protein